MRGAVCTIASHGPSARAGAHVTTGCPATGQVAGAPHGCASGPESCCKAHYPEFEPVTAHHLAAHRWTKFAVLHPGPGGRLDNQLIILLQSLIDPTVCTLATAVRGCPLSKAARINPARSISRCTQAR